MPPPDHATAMMAQHQHLSPFVAHPQHATPSQQLHSSGTGGFYHHMAQNSLNADVWGRPGADHRQLHSHHQYSQSFSGHMHRHMASHPVHMSHYQHQMAGMHPQAQSKRGYDAPLMEQKMPVSLHGDPYLSSSDHVRQASHDSGLGYPITPYQSEPGIMDFEEMDGSLHGNHMGSSGPSTLAHSVGQQHPHPPPNRSLIEQLQGPSELGMEIENNFQPAPTGDILPELASQENHYPFPGGAAWV